MSLAVLKSRALAGMEAPRSHGRSASGQRLAFFHDRRLAGNRGQGIASDRVRAALQNARFEFPARRITVNLAPADLPKESGRFDLPIALGILAASGQMPADELDALRIRRRTVAVRRTAANPRRAGDDLRHASRRRHPAAGLHPAARQCRRSRAGAERHHLPRGFPVAGMRPLRRARRRGAADCDIRRKQAGSRSAAADFSDVKGQLPAKRALEVAAAGGHSVLLVGPPGTGKSMLASRFAGILPPMTDQEALESAAVQSLTPGFSSAQLEAPPVSGAASHGLRRGAGGRRRHSAPRRNFAGALRRFVFG